jgi:hypothetical protein
VKKLSSEQRERLLRMIWQRQRVAKKLNRQLQREIRRRKRRKVKTPVARIDALTALRRTGFQGNDVVKKAKRGRVIIPIPEKFSFLSNPTSVVDILYSLMNLADRHGFDEVWFDHSECKELGVCASITADLVIVALRDKWRRTGRNIRFGGTYPSDPRVAEILRATGVIKHLQVAGHILDDPKYIHFPLLVGIKKDPKARDTSDHERAAQKVAEYFDSCLRIQEMRLASAGFREITKMLGEVLNNAEEHSGTDKWYIFGYMIQEKEGFGRCNIAIFNFGKTIYQTLEELDSKNSVKRLM